MMTVNLSCPAHGEVKVKEANIRGTLATYPDKRRVFILNAQCPIGGEYFTENRDSKVMPILRAVGVRITHVELPIIQEAS